jgi:mxaJ protein
MSSRCRKRPAEALATALVAAALALVAPAATAAAEPLRVCADPNNLPFSNRAGEGFENALAELVAQALARDGVAYEWFPQRRGFVRNTLGAHLCDVVLGVPAHYELVRTTRPYYRSTYVFVYRRADRAPPSSLDDPELRALKIGVPVVGDDYASTPGAAALGRRGLVRNIVGFSVYGDYSEPHPPSKIVDAVARGDVDLAIAWGPLAGYFAARAAAPLAIAPVTPAVDAPYIPFTYDIAMGVRKDDIELAAALDEVIATHGAEIRAVLERFGVPLVDAAVARVAGATTRAQEEP